MSDNLPSYRKAFPSLTDANHILTSPKDATYNCFGHALDTKLFWNPTPSLGGKTYWPPKAPRERTLNAFIKAFEYFGYQTCENGDYEAGFEKIAIYTKDDIPQHVAKQLEEKAWTSKLGKGIDLSHDLKALCGPNFGDVSTYMKRPILKK